MVGISCLTFLQCFGTLEGHLANKKPVPFIPKGFLPEQVEEEHCGETWPPHHHTRLTAFFQDNLGKPAPER